MKPGRHGKSQFAVSLRTRAMATRWIGCIARVAVRLWGGLLTVRFWAAVMGKRPFKSGHSGGRRTSTAWRPLVSHRLWLYLSPKADVCMRGQSATELSIGL